MTDDRSGAGHIEGSYCDLLPSRGAARVLMLALMFSGALFLRLIGLDRPPLDQVPIKQYRSALIARYLYYDVVGTGAPLPAWKQQVARANRDELGYLVPPLLEGAAAVLYRITGGERLWIGRLLSIVSWLAGGMALYRAGIRGASSDGAVCALAFYLFLPFSTLLSEAFFPDPAMAAGTAAALLFNLRYAERPTTSRLATAAMVSSLAMLLKGMAAFFVLTSFIVAAMRQKTPRRHIPLFLVIAVLPTILFYFFVIRGGDLVYKDYFGFIPVKLTTVAFWQSWCGRIYDSIGLPAAAAAAIGLLMLPRGKLKDLVLGSWVGYGVYGFVKTYHIVSHAYYQLPLVPIAALSMVPVAPAVFRQLDDPMRRRLGRLVLAGMGLFAIGVGIHTQRHLPDTTREVGIAKEIGEVVGHSSRAVILVSPSFDGRPLTYHGEFAAEYWLDSADRNAGIQEGSRDTVEARMQVLDAAGAREFFIIRTRAEFDKQPDLRAYLVNFPRLRDTNDYLIFDLRHRQR